jgi:chromosomal replication initiation ATPase DnaA
MSHFIQLPLSLSYRKAFGRKDFIVAPCNLEAVSWIDKWPNWPTPALLIYGESGAGKTHLSSIFSEYKINASELTDDFLPFFQKKIVVEDLENLASEVALFHLFNFIRDLGGSLLLTAKSIPNFSLPDLQSRIQAIPKAPITIPDENFVFQFLSLSFKERHVLVDDSVLNYAVRHMERSFDTIQRVIQTADTLSLAENRKITIPVMKTTLEQIGDSTCDSCQN